MSKPDQRLIWAARYRELLEGFTEALGGESITPTRKAMAKTLATLQAQLSTLSDRFANTQGGTPDDVAQFLKISDTIATLLESVGLKQAMQQPVVNDGTDAREELQAILNRLFEAQLTEEKHGVFRHRRSEKLIDNRDHIDGCMCEPCVWQRNASPEEIAEAIEWRSHHGMSAPPGVVVPEPSPVSPSSPKPPVLTVAKSEPPAPPPPAPVPPPLVAEKTTTEKYFEWAASGTGERIHDWSPMSNPNWPRLR
jgi:hypothetical protein